MINEFPILRGSYLNDLLAQPGAIADTLGELSQLGTPTLSLDRRKIVLTGMGSSLHALHPLNIRLIQSGRLSMMVETAELIYSQMQLIDDETIVVAVSQSGRSAETVALLEKIRSSGRKPFVIGVTNTPDSPLALRSNFVVPLVAGVEATVSCKTYLATLVGLEWLGGLLTGADLPSIIEELKPASRLVASYYENAPGHVRYLVERLGSLKNLFIVGRGSSLAAVGTAGLTIKESTRFHSEGMSSPSFRHGPLEMVSPGLFAMAYAGDSSTAALNATLVHDIIAAGGHAALVSAKSEVPVFTLPTDSPRVRPVMEMLPAQMLSLALAVIAGKQPGVFERASKITDTE